MLDECAKTSDDRARIRFRVLWVIVTVVIGIIVDGYCRRRVTLRFPSERYMYIYIYAYHWVASNFLMCTMGVSAYLIKKKKKPSTFFVTVNGDKYLTNSWFCRKNCFTTDFFKGCLDVLLLEDEVENIQKWIKQLHGADPIGSGV